LPSGNASEEALDQERGRAKSGKSNATRNALR
jgi:hypothetical protein